MRAVFSASPRYPRGTDPRWASQPTSSSPGSSTRVRSALTTTVPGPGTKVPVDTDPAVDVTPIWTPVSDAPATSEIMTLGSTFSRRSLRPTLKVAPPLPKARRVLASWPPRSSSSTTGRAMASPTTEMPMTRSRATVSHTSTGSIDRVLVGNTMVAPMVM